MNFYFHFLFKKYKFNLFYNYFFYNYKYMLNENSIVYLLISILLILCGYYAIESASSAVDGAISGGAGRLSEVPEFFSL